MLKSQRTQLLQIINMGCIIQVFKTYTAGGRGEKINKQNKNQSRPKYKLLLYLTTN